MEHNSQKTKYNRSLTAKSIFKTTPLYKTFTRKITGDGANTNFWYDNWMGEILRTKFTSLLLENEEKRTVKLSIQNKSSNNKWNLKNLPINFSLDICHKIRMQPVSICPNTRPEEKFGTSK